LRTLVLGLGNTICGDDGVGIRTAQALKEDVCGLEAEVAETTAAGIGLLDTIMDYERMIVVDAIQTKGGKAGQVYRLGLEDLPASLHSATLHDVDLPTALELGRRLGMEMPREVIVYAVEVADVATFREGCTREVERAIPEVASLVLQELKSP
jgi:hydrogenase maturation protease